MREMDLDIRLINTLLIFVLSACSNNNHQAFVHVRSETAPERPRQIVLFLDGTGNHVTSRTNVRRLYELTTAKHRPNILTYYDPGVGTAGTLTSTIFGGGAGAGLGRNLEEALVFLTENYRQGDQISLFGFSRGAYSAGVLATMISNVGLPNFEQGGVNERPTERHRRASKVVAKWYQEIIAMEKAAGREASRLVSDRLPVHPSAAAHAWRDAYWKALRKTPQWADLRNGKKITVLGLWDPVESILTDQRSIMGTVTSNGRNAEFDRHRGHKFHPFALNSNIEECYIAYSLDERRLAFVAEVPDQRPSGFQGMPGKYEFVWFPGDHSDTGGGWQNDKDISGLSMNWLLAKVGTRLLGEKGDEYRVYANPRAPRHDYYYSSKAYHTFGGFRVRGEMFSSSLQVHISKPNEYIMRPMGKDLWTMKIHSSVVDRMRAKNDYFVDVKTIKTVDLNEQRSNETQLPTELVQGKSYCPHPFRGEPVTKNASRGWVRGRWTPEEVGQRYEIVQ